MKPKNQITVVGLAVVAVLLCVVAGAQGVQGPKQNTDAKAPSPMQNTECTPTPPPPGE